MFSMEGLKRDLYVRTTNAKNLDPALCIVFRVALFAHVSSLVFTC